jgi:hypothetical protein
VTVATFALGIGALLAVTRGRVSRAQLPIAMASLTTLTLVAAPVSWTHYQVMQFPGVALFAGGLALRGAWKKLGWALLSAAFIYPVPVTVLRAMYAANGDVWPNTPVANYFWISTAPVAGLVLYGLMVAEIGRGRSGPAPLSPRQSLRLSPGGRLPEPDRASLLPERIGGLGRVTTKWKRRCFKRGPLVGQHGALPTLGTEGSIAIPGTGERKVT